MAFLIPTFRGSERPVYSDDNCGEMNHLKLFLFLSLTAISCHGFRPTSPTAAFAPRSSRSLASSSRSANSLLRMCICIDCARVTNCAAYHFVEEKHDQPHMTDHPTFTPRDGSPTIHVNIRSTRSTTDEVQRMWREHKTETQRAEENQQGDGPLRGETVYDLSPLTTYEYDVVACADFVQDKGCWVRNMPQEIKDANPQFVPT